MDYFGEIACNIFHYPSVSAIKDYPKFEFKNFGLRFTYSLNQESEIETGLILSNKDFYSPQGWLCNIMPMIYFYPKLYFMDIPIIYKYKIFDMGILNLNLIGGIIASIPLFEYVNSSYEFPLYHVAYTDPQFRVLTKNLDFYPLCMNVNIGFRFTGNNTKKFKFEFGPVFQSAIMPFSKKIEGNTVDLGINNNPTTVLNPDKGFAPYFIGFDLIFSFNFYKKN
jgi:hypothetical protein